MFLTRVFIVKRNGDSGKVGRVRYYVSSVEYCVLLGGVY